MSISQCESVLEADYFFEWKLEREVSYFYPIGMNHKIDFY